jgi:hypothetical protein
MSLGLADSINAVSEAVKTLARNLRNATSDGRDVDELLRNIASMRKTRSAADLRENPAESWMMREAQLLLRFRPEQRMGRLDQLERFPSPPAFYR